MANVADGMYLGAEYGTFPLPAIRAGKTGAPELITQGGTFAGGNILFAAIPTAGDMVTLNGVVVEFTAAASDPTATGTALDPVLVNIKASLTLTLDEAVTVLNNAGAPTAVAVATYSNVAGTTLTVVYDTRGAVGNTYTLAASVATPSAATLTGGQDITQISVATENTKISLSQSVDQVIVLPNGDEAQNKTIYMIAKGGAGNAVVTPTNLAGGTTITFDADKEYSVLKFLDGQWVQIAGTATVA